MLQQNEPASNGRATSASPATPPAFNLALPDELIGVAPSNVVAFRWDGGWSQVPVQVDEREMMTLNRIYNGGYPGCSDPCYNPPTTAASQALVRHLNYTDGGTWVGPDTDPTLDRDDEVALMARDAGGRASTEFAPSGVDPASAVEVKIADPLDGGEGYVYLFESTGGLDPSAGASYVQYDFNLANGPYKEGAYASRTFPTRAEENGNSMRYGPRPETPRCGPRTTSAASATAGSTTTSRCTAATRPARTSWIATTRSSTHSTPAACERSRPTRPARARS